MAKALRVTANIVIPENGELGLDSPIIKWIPENRIT